MTLMTGCLTLPLTTPAPTRVITENTPQLSLPTPTPSSDQKEFRIVGYVTDSETVVSQIQFDKLTHINYAFLIPKKDGTFFDVANPWKLKEVVAKAHENGVKVLISVGGWGWDTEFEALAAGPETRATFVGDLNDFVGSYDLDGVDIDWEYPDPGESAQNYVALMQELSAVMRAQHKLLTAAVVAIGPTGDGVSADVFANVDFLNVMAYDGSDTNHSSFRYAEEALDYWSGRGLPADKMVLGVPFYTRPDEVTYRKLVQTNPAEANVDEFDYYGSTLYYNGIPTMQQKTELALRQASGMMIWALAYDTGDSTSLLSAIYETAYGQATHRCC